jgi:hypothetical protein
VLKRNYLMFDFLHNSFDRAALKAIFNEYSPAAQDRFMQRVYDSGVSGTLIGRALDISDVYDRIDAYRGRGPASRPA